MRSSPPGFSATHDAADDVLAVADLPVELRVLGEDLPADQVDELAVDRGRADVHGHGIVAPGSVAGLDVDQARAAVLAHRPHQRCGQLEPLRADHLRDLADHGQVGFEPVLIVPELEVADQPGEIRQVVLGRGGRNFQVFFLHRRQKKPLLLEIVEVELPDAGGPPRGWGPG